MRRCLCLCLAALAVVMFQASCASSRGPQLAAAPQAIELQQTAARGTLHFPAGLYVFEDEADGGYYYRAPRSIRQVSFGGSYGQTGGIFLYKKPPHRIRGYLVIAGERRKMGNLTSVPHALR